MFERLVHRFTRTGSVVYENDFNMMLEVVQNPHVSYSTSNSYFIATHNQNRWSVKLQNVIFDSTVNGHVYLVFKTSFTITQQS